MPEIRYRLAPGLEVVPVGEGRFALRSDFAALELSGDTAKEFVEQVLSLLRQPLTFAEIAERMPGYRQESLRSQVDALVSEGILVASAGERPAKSPSFAALLDSIGLGSERTLERLGRLKVGIFGLEAHGAHVASMLGGVGVGDVLLVDPFPFTATHFALTPVEDPTAVGRSRQAAVSELLARSGVRTEKAGDAPLTRERVFELAATCHLLMSCWDRGYSGHHWVNEASREHAIPALFSELRATTSFAGPFHLPNRSACWMCCRMRTLSCEEDFDLAMAYEEHLDRKKEPALAARPVLPILPVQLASTLALEALKYLLPLNQPTLVDHILEFDALDSKSRLHSVLVKPDCPVCSKKKRRDTPTLAAICARPPGLTPPPDLADRLVSPRMGVLSGFAAASREPSEPPLPLVWRARISNHRFLSERDDSHAACSGKGMTRTEAWVSCLGEAVERYSGGCWSPEEITFARRGELDGRSVDPADLVLYRPEQYATLKYAPYTEENKLGWVQARSLISGELVWVPAIAVFMEYQVHGPEEFLFPITSNGLAAGSSLCDAVLRAIYEILERDALLIAWLNKLPGRHYEAADHPHGDIRQLALAYRRRGVRLALVELPTDHLASVFAGIAFQEGGLGGPYATVGLGANLDARIAARRAAIEVGQVRPALRRWMRGAAAKRVAELAENPADVKTLEDHALLYASSATAGAFDFLFGEKAEWDGGRAWEPAQALQRLLEHFGAKGQEVLCVDLTPPDLEPLGLFTARAILPGFQPIWFGHGEQRLGGKRLYEAPRALGFPAAVGPESLNPMPHPLA